MAGILAWVMANPGTAAALAAIAASMMPTDSLLRKLLLLLFTKPVPPGPTPVVPPTPPGPQPVVPPVPPAPAPNDRPILDLLIQILPALVPAVKSQQSRSSVIDAESWQPARSSRRRRPKSSKAAKGRS